jgi:hypothetical protein
MKKINFIKSFRASASQLNSYSIAGDWMRLAVQLDAAGSTLTAADAALWADAGYLPGEAAPLIADGVTPQQAAELDELATNIAGGPEAQAMQRIDELVRDGVLVDPSQVRWREDPRDPLHVIVDVMVAGEHPRLQQGYWSVETLVHGEQLYTDLLDRIRQDDALVAAMWTDAESRPDELDVPGTHWTVALLEDSTPAAWCAARVQNDRLITCHSNYEPRAHRSRGLYAAAYHARHRDVIRAYRLPAVTYLFEQPIGLHERDGWHRTDLHGVSDLGHRWWKLRRPGTGGH